jgi:hypothetical protein
MTLTEARQLVAQSKKDGTEIGEINLEIKRLAERGITSYQHRDYADLTQPENLKEHFVKKGFTVWIEERYHARGCNIYNLVIDWS